MDWNCVALCLRNWSLERILDILYSKLWLGPVPYAVINLDGGFINYIYGCFHKSSNSSAPKKREIRPRSFGLGRNWARSRGELKLSPKEQGLNWFYPFVMSCYHVSACSFRIVKGGHTCYRVQLGINKKIPHMRGLEFGCNWWVTCCDTRLHQYKYKFVKEALFSWAVISKFRLLLWFRKEPDETWLCRSSCLCSAFTNMLLNKLLMLWSFWLWACMHDLRIDIQLHGSEIWIWQPLDCLYWFCLV